VENRERHGSVVVPAFFIVERSPPPTCEVGGGAKLRGLAGVNAGVTSLCEIRSADFFNTGKKQRAKPGGWRRSAAAVVRSVKAARRKRSGEALRPNLMNQELPISALDSPSYGEMNQRNL
jgi:hypothetical protein